MHLIDGKALAERLREELRVILQNTRETPRLAVLLVGDDPASALYVRLKKKAGEDIGIRVDVTHKDGTAPMQELIQLIETWNHDASIHGILVQLPLPVHYDEQKVIDTMDPKKDVDGFHPINVAALYAGNVRIIPPVHEGILRLINQTPVRVNGARTVIIGNSEIFTKPLERLLATAGAYVTRLGADAIDDERVKNADIVISAVGSPHFIKPSHVKDGAVLIDVGTTKLDDKTLAGDVDIEAFTTTDCWITPVPGGVGPMTVTQLLWNVYHICTSS